MPLDERLSDYWRKIQAELFPSLQEYQLGPLGERHRQLVTVLEMARPERFLPHVHGRPGRPRADRAALSRAFLAKTIFNIDDTLGLISACAWTRPCGGFAAGAERARCRARRPSAVPSPSSRPRAWGPGCWRRWSWRTTATIWSAMSPATVPPLRRASAPPAGPGHQLEARPAAQGQGTEDAAARAPPGTPARPEPGGDDGRAPPRLRAGGQAERPGLPHPLDRLQAAHRTRPTATSRSPPS